MKTILIGCLCLMFYPVRSQIVAMEYFIDDDPGIGIATEVADFTPANSVNLNFTATSDTNAGIHNVGYRVKTADGIWSHTNFSTIYVLNNVLSGDIVSIEYFIDNDPGIGNGTNITSFSPAGNVIVPLPVDNTLSSGIHNVGYRTLSSENQWSHTNFSTFYITGNNVLPNISQLEYFWDEDNGFANNTIVDVTANFNLAGYPLLSDVPDFAIGSSHVFLVRAIDSEGLPSHTNYPQGNIIIEEALNVADLQRNKINIYPNPVDAQLHITSVDDNLIQLTVYDMLGKKILSSCVKGQETIDTSSWNSGNYLVYLWKNQHTIQVYKIVKR